MQQQEVLKFIFKSKVGYILDHRESVELFEWNFAKLFSYNPDNFMEDEFTLNLISRTYNRIKNETIDGEILEEVNKMLK